MNSIALAAAFIFIGWCVSQHAKTLLADRRAIAMQRLEQEREHDVTEQAFRARELELRERELALKELPTKPLPVPHVETFPPSVAPMLDESESWARDDATQLIAESYIDAGGDWERAGSTIGRRYASAPESRLPPEVLNDGRARVN